MDHYPPSLHIRKSPSASVDRLGENTWHLEIPAHNRMGYRLAQLDDHGTFQSSLPWQPPLVFSLQARVSAENLPGTWGFGFWNEPASFVFSDKAPWLRLPTLPQAAWFFYASAQNYLSFRNDLPANGLLAATFCSKVLPSLIVDLASPILGLSLIPGAAQWLRRMLCRIVKQDACQIHANLTSWHAYRLEWEMGQVRFFFDDTKLLLTDTSPQPPLSLVIWIDNQYAAMPPEGGLKYGYLPNPQPAWLEIKDVRLQIHA